MALQERIPVTTPEQIAQTAALAAAIWTEHYAGLLPEGQPAYMVEKFQSAAAIARQIREDGYRYFLLTDGKKPVGFTGVQVTGKRLSSASST